MMINNHINDLLSYALDKKLIQNDDLEYTYNRLTDILQINEYVKISIDLTDIKQLSIILNLILNFSYKSGLFPVNSIKQHDLF